MRTITAKVYRYELIGRPLGPLIGYDWYLRHPEEVSLVGSGVQSDILLQELRALSLLCHATTRLEVSSLLPLQR